MCTAFLEIFVKRHLKLQICARDVLHDSLCVTLDTKLLGVGSDDGSVIILLSFPQLFSDSSVTGAFTTYLSVGPFLWRVRRCMFEWFTDRCVVDVDSFSVCDHQWYPLHG